MKTLRIFVGAAEVPPDSKVTVTGALYVCPLCGWNSRTATEAHDPNCQAAVEALFTSAAESE